MARPDVKAKVRAHLLSDSNPLRDPTVRARAHETLRGQGWKSLTGGNGTGPTKPQLMLAERLGWKMEVAVRTGGQPHVYKFDLAHLMLKIAVEVDGASHLSKKVKAADERQRQWCEANDWLLLRFTNQEILADPDGVAMTILASTTSRQPTATTLPTGS